MNTESLRIALHTPDSGPHWSVSYRGFIDTPHDWSETGDFGTAVVWFEVSLEPRPDITRALDFARRWAVDSGFKAGPAKPAGGNTFEIKLRRP